MPATPARAVAALGVAALVAVLGACSDATTPPAATPEPTATDPRAGAYPVRLDSPFGSTELDEPPDRVAVVSAVDLDIALSLGIVPVTAPRLGDLPPDPWTQNALADAEEEVDFYDSTDGTDYAAIAAAEPDVILATGGATLPDDYDQLAAIAPVVSYQGVDGLVAMTWADRTTTVAAALGVPDQGAAVVAGVRQVFAGVRAAHPQFEGRTVAYAVARPDQISVVSVAGSDVSFFADLGFTLPGTASQLGAPPGALGPDDVELLDADVLLVGYPAGDQGVAARTALEADPRFLDVPAVATGHYGVVVDDAISPLAHPTPLSQTWTLERLLPTLEAAVAGS